MNARAALLAFDKVGGLLHALHKITAELLHLTLRIIHARHA